MDYVYGTGGEAGIGRDTGQDGFGSSTGRTQVKPLRFLLALNLDLPRVHLHMALLHPHSALLGQEQLSQKQRSHKLLEL